MDLDIIIVRKVRERNIWYHLHVEANTWHKWTYLQNRLTDIENRCVVANGEWGREG